MTKPRFVFHAYIEEDPEAGAYSSVCLENNVASMGDTPQEALLNLREAVHLYMKTRIKRGQFDMLVRPARKGVWKKYFEQQRTRISKSLEFELIAS